MVKTIGIRDRVVYLDGNNFVSIVMKGCAIQKSDLLREPQTSWLTFNSAYMDEQMNQEGKIIIEYIFDLRRQKRDEEAIALSDAFFQSFTPLMNILAEQRNFYEISHLWTWLISKVKKFDEENSIEFGKGVHKGTAFYFLGFSQLMMRDIDGAYLSFAEAAKEDEILPKSVLKSHQKELPPVVKILLLDLSEDNFAYGIVKQIRETINSWENQYTGISRGTPVFTSIENAINKNVMPVEISIHLNYAFTKAFVLDLKRKGFLRPTFLTITQLGESILRFARTLEDFIRASQNLGKDDSVFKYCNNTWFPSENWSKISSYENDVKGLIDDFINNRWKLSRDGRNMVLTFKIRNAIAHRIPNDSKLFENYIEIVLAISNSFGFVCDEISK